MKWVCKLLLWFPQAIFTGRLFMWHWRPADTGYSCFHTATYINLSISNDATVTCHLHGSIGKSSSLSYRYLNWYGLNPRPDVAWDLDQDQDPDSHPGVGSVSKSGVQCKQGSRFCYAESDLTQLAVIWTRMLETHLLWYGPGHEVMLKTQLMWYRPGHKAMLETHLL